MGGSGTRRILPIVWVVGAAAVLLASRPAAAWCETSGTPGECRCRERAESAARFSGVHSTAAQPAAPAPGFGLITAGVIPAAPGARNVEAAAGAVVIVHVYDTDFSTNPAGQPVADPVIQAGDTIRWVFDSGIHTATSTAGSAERFDSDVRFQGDAPFEHTFTTPGTFDYYCTLHGVDLGPQGVIGMGGTVTVLVPEPRAGLIALVLIALRGGRRGPGLTTRSRS
jgi:plastocyanin